MSTPHSPAVPLYLTTEIRQVEARAATLPDKPRLMERAGLAAAQLARRIAGDGGKPVLVLAGPGNNGGDAFVLARHLRQWWFKVTVVFAGNVQKLPPDAAAAFAAWQATGGNYLTDIPSGENWDLIVDGLFGIGLQREVSGIPARLVATAGLSRSPVLALDIPSGIASDTGRIMGCALRADHTLTFIGLKPGLLTLDGPDYCGQLHLDTLDINAPALLPPSGMLLTAAALDGLMPPRQRNSHKGTYGCAGIMGGAQGMVGAAFLAGRAALKMGTGRVYVGLHAQQSPPLDAGQPELMLRPAKDVPKLNTLNCLAIGPGLGTSASAKALLRAALKTERPLVVDADGLNLVGSAPELGALMTARRHPTIITPHPAEAARLLACSTPDIQADRVQAALTLARRFNAMVVLKGAGSVCAAADGRWSINTSGNPGMASAGMGDVLTGMITALIAQGVEPYRALTAAVYLHGAAADARVTAGHGPAGLTASDVIDEARLLLNG